MSKELRNSLIKTSAKYLLDDTNNYKRKPGAVYSSIEVMVEKRSKGNAVNELPLQAAKVLCNRGLVQHPGMYIYYICMLCV